MIGASAGGVETLSKLVAGLPSDLPAAVFIVLHLSSGSPSVLPRILNRAGALSVSTPKHGEDIQPGRIYVAPPDDHLLLKPGQIHLARGPKENGHRPSIDVLFRTAARVYGSQVVGVVLSGLLDDGTAGLLAIKQQGGVAIVQSPDEALFPSMPRSAIENVEVDRVLPVSEIAEVLTRLASEPVAEEKISVSEELEIETDIAELGTAAMQREERPGTPSGFACPDCGGVLWELNEKKLLRFRCRTGHAFSVETLLSRQSEELEDALWSALRALEETATLRHRMAKRAMELGHPTRAHSYKEQAQIAQRRALLIRQALLKDISDPDEAAEPESRE